MELKKQVIDLVRAHRLWLHQKCKITNEGLYAEIAQHFFVMVSRISLIPKTSSHTSPILIVENGREKLVDFMVNRYFLTAVMDWALRRGTCNNAIARQFTQCHDSLIRSAWFRIKKERPTEFHVDQAKINSTEIMFGGVDEFFPFVQRGELKVLSTTIQVSHSGKGDREPVRYREFYSPELDRKFFAKESAILEWGQDSDWRMISNHMQGFPIMGRTRGFCLPRLACAMAVGRLIELDLGRRSNDEDELISESLDSLRSRPEHKDDGFPWEAFIQSVSRRSFETVIRAEHDYPDHTIARKAEICGMSYKVYTVVRSAAFRAAKEWYQAGGLDLS